VSRCLTCVQSFQQVLTGVPVTLRLRVTWTMWHYWSGDFQVYSHFNSVTPVSLSRVTSIWKHWCPGDLQYNSHLIILSLVSRWLTGLQSLQHVDTSVLVTDMSIVTSTRWHQCSGDVTRFNSAGWHLYPGHCQVKRHFSRVTPVSPWLIALESLQYGDTNVLVTDRSTVTSIKWHQHTSTGSHQFAIAWQI
jgi:hypothetical protein